MTAMTEEQAETKWCPFARVTAADGTGGNRYRMDIDAAEAACFTKCIGPHCMAWRWDITWSSMTEEGQGGDVVLRLERLNGEPKLGYCGLAGNGLTGGNP